MPIGVAAVGGGGALKGSLGRGVSPRPLDLFIIRTGYCSFRYPV